MAEVETEFHAELPDAHIIWKECKINELNQEVVDTFIKKIKCMGMNSIWRLSGTLVMEKNSYGIAGGNDRE